MIYCFDSHTFIWAIKKQAESHDAHKLDEAKALMNWIQDSKHQVMIPTFVIAECLIREPIENHRKVLQECYKKFMVVSFDDRCALKYGELLRLENWQEAKEKAKSNGVRREKMKIDHMIICCALVNGANAIFSDDGDLETFSKGNIRVLSPSIIPRQTQMSLNP